MMPTESETRATVSGKPSKVVELVRKRLRQLRRVVVVLAACAAVAVTAFAIWWLNSLNGLPDIGDPFDVAAFRALSIPDDQNAFALLRRAEQMHWRLIEQGDRLKWFEIEERANEMLLRAPRDADFQDPALCKWVEANRPVVELFLKAAERPDALLQPIDALSLYEPPVEREGSNALPRLTLLEARKRGANGDLAGAWDCHRAILRMTAHRQRRARFKERLRSALFHKELRQGLASWAADPRTTIPQLRRALDVMIECRPRDEWDAHTLKQEYLDLMLYLDGPVDPDPDQIEHELTYRVDDYQSPTEFSVRLHHAKRHLLREPERSRRVVRLLFANWLAQAEPPGQKPRPPAVRARFHAPWLTNATAILLYPVGPEAPAGARALAPQEVARWLITTNDARYALRYGSHMSLSSIRQRERRVYRDLLVLVASELFRRERGAPPPTDEALVGTYLQSLPDNGSAELADGTTPTVE